MSELFNYHHHCDLASLDSVRIDVDDSHINNYNSSFSSAVDWDSIPSIYGLDIHLKLPQHSSDLYNSSLTDSLWPPVVPVQPVETVRSVPKNLQPQADLNAECSPELNSTLLCGDSEYRKLISRTNKFFQNANNISQDCNIYRSLTSNKSTNVNQLPTNTAGQEHYHNSHGCTHKVSRVNYPVSVPTHNHQNLSQSNQYENPRHQELTDYHSGTIPTGNSVNFSQNKKQVKHTSQRKYSKIAQNWNGNTLRLKICKGKNTNAGGPAAAASKQLKTPVSNPNKNAATLNKVATTEQSKRLRHNTRKSDSAVAHGKLIPVTIIANRNSTVPTNAGENSTSRPTTSIKSVNISSSHSAQQKQINSSYVARANPHNSSAATGNANNMTEAVNKSQAHPLPRQRSGDSNQNQSTPVPANNESAAIRVTYMTDAEFLHACQQEPLTLRRIQHLTQPLPRP